MCWRSASPSSRRRTPWPNGTGPALHGGQNGPRRPVARGAALSLEAVIGRTRWPATRASIAADLTALGLRHGAIVLVHSALSTLGFVAGGAVALLDALGDVVGPDGTIVMPAQSADLSDPALWQEPAVPDAWIAAVRDALPPYDPLRSPTWQLGVVAELFRTWPGVRRSAHPVCSFAACGPHAAAIVEPHDLDDPFGEASPLARLYRMGAVLLLIGAGWETCTALHLAERRAQPDQAPLQAGAPILVDGIRVWAPWCEYPHDSGCFPRIGFVLERDGVARIGLVGTATGRLVPMAEAVDRAVGLLKDPG